MSRAIRATGPSTGQPSPGGRRQDECQPSVDPYRGHMHETRPTHAEMAQLVGLLEEAGLVEVHTDDDGEETYRLTAEGVGVGHLLAMGDETDGDAVLRGLLEGRQG